MFFLLKLLVMAVIAAAFVRAGMHAQELLGEGRSLWSVPGLEAVGERLHTDIDSFIHIFQ